MCHISFCSLILASSPHFFTWKALCSGRTKQTLSYPFGRPTVRLIDFPARASKASLSRSLNSRSIGSGVLRALEMASIVLNEGLPSPVVISEINEMETPERSANSCFDIFFSSSNRSTFVKNIYLYTAIVSMSTVFSR